jgi:cyclophilin family peptidyl-prolyl cis-trans isomerase
MSTASPLAVASAAVAPWGTETTMNPETVLGPTAAPGATAPAIGEEVAVLDTSAGRIVLMLFPDKAPNHVANFKQLAQDGFYDGTRFHRCIPGFMIQGGDPTSKDLNKSGAWGTGGPSTRVKAEFTDLKHTRGVLSMARTSDPDSAGSQFFITVADSPFLDGKYSAFGVVIQGMDVVDTIVATGPAAQGDNGRVEPERAVVLQHATVRPWPMD